MSKQGDIDITGGKFGATDIAAAKFGDVDIPIGGGAPPLLDAQLTIGQISTFYGYLEANPTGNLIPNPQNGITVLNFYANSNNDLISFEVTNSSPPINGLPAIQVEIFGNQYVLPAASGRIWQLTSADLMALFTTNLGNTVPFKIFSITPPLLDAQLTTVSINNFADYSFFDGRGSCSPKDFVADNSGNYEILGVRISLLANQSLICFLQVACSNLDINVNDTILADINGTEIEFAATTFVPAGNGNTNFNASGDFRTLGSAIADQTVPLKILNVTPA